MTGCAGAGANRPTHRWWSHYDGFRVLDRAELVSSEPERSEGVIAGVAKEPGGLETWDLVDRFDASIDDDVKWHPTLVRIEHATGNVMRDFNDDNNVATTIYAIETLDPATRAPRWFVVSIRRDKSSQAFVASMSPPLKGVVKIAQPGAQAMLRSAGRRSGASSSRARRRRAPRRTRPTTASCSRPTRGADCGILARCQSSGVCSVLS